MLKDKGQTKNKFIGIDIGGTKITIILSDGFRILKILRIKTGQDFKKNKINIKLKVEKLSQGNNILAIGIGVAGLVKNNKLIFCPNIPGTKRINFNLWWPAIPIFVDNDAKLFALNQYFSNPKLKNKSFLALTIGTGIGRAYCRNNKIKKLKNLELPEVWEKEYQAIRDKKNYKKLAEFLSLKIEKLLKRFNIESLVIGGGLLNSKLFKNQLRLRIKKNLPGVRLLFSAPQHEAVALGAVYFAKSNLEKQRC